jgi:hypothetical protein
MKSRSALEWVKAYDRIHKELTIKGFKPKLQTLDNEASTALKNFFTSNDIAYQLVPPRCHRRNAAEHAIRTFSPSLRDDVEATVELYSTFVKQLKAENPQLNVSEVSFARGKAGKNSYGKRHSTGISNVSNANVDDRFFEKHEYNDITPDQKNTLRLKRPKRCHVGKSHTGSGNNNGKNNGKSVTIKSLTRSIAALSTKIYKFSLPYDNEDEDESSDEEEGTSNRSNAALTRQSKKNKRANN